MCPLLLPACHILLWSAGGFECTADRCGEDRNEDYACHCSSDCLENHDCCSNYKATCQGSGVYLVDTFTPTTVFSLHLHSYYCI